MRTNKERTDEVIRRANDETYNFNHVPAKVRKNKRWVAIVASCMIAVLTAGVVASLLIYFNNKPQNLDNMYIADFETFQAIGAGQNRSSSNQSALIGINNMGLMETLKYTKDKNPNSQKFEIKMRCRAMYSLRNFTFVLFATPKEKSVITKAEKKIDRTINDGYSVAYIIDNRTGKFYSLESLKEGDLSVAFYYNYDESTCYGINGAESEYAVFFKMRYIEEEVRDVIFKAYVENGVLVIKTVFDTSTNLLGSRQRNCRFFVDKYGNIYLIGEKSEKNMNFENEYYIEYQISNDGTKLNKLGDYCFLSLNGIVYNEDMTKTISPDGDVVDNEGFKQAKWFFYSEELIKTDGNDEYYYTAKDKNSIYVISWKDEQRIEFEQRTINLNLDDDTISYFASTKDYLYLCGNQKIHRIEIVSGKDEGFEFNDSYYFTSIQADELGGVDFTAMSMKNENVVGKIYNNGSIDIRTTPPQYEIYYIKPLR